MIIVIKLSSGDPQSARVHVSLCISLLCVCVSFPYITHSPSVFTLGRIFTIIHIREL